MKVNFVTNQNGITLVLVAIILAVLLMFAALAIDISYMYVVKNELQVAADAAALAGAAKLDGTNSTLQLPARQAAWRFACKNIAAENPKHVFLVTSPSDYNSPACDASDTPSDLNNANAPTGDIVIGYWNGSSCTTRIPEDGLATCVKTVARRNGETPGMPRVSVFFGRVFRFIGADWSTMTAIATATATMPPRATSFIAMGNTACPAVHSARCPSGSTYPTKCPLTPPLILQATPTTYPADQQFGWTSLLLRPGGCSQFRDLMCTNSPFQDTCGTSGIWGLTGTCNAALQDYQSLMYDPTFDTANKNIDALGRVTGWWVMIPQDSTNDRPMQPPPPDPRPVMGHILVHIIAVCVHGASGCRGFHLGQCSDWPNPSPPPANVSSVIVIDQISCIPCGTLAFGLKPVLVK